jgi:hypothetical protein
MNNAVVHTQPPLNLDPLLTHNKKMADRKKPSRQEMDELIQAEKKKESERQEKFDQPSQIGVIWDLKKFKTEGEKCNQELAMGRLQVKMNHSTPDEAAYLELTCGEVGFEKDQLGNYKRKAKGKFIACWKTVDGRTYAVGHLESQAGLERREADSC